ncbi:extracellular solute-binding protein [Natranaerobius trueperi]|uniref:Iron transporter n=1 Tax=Natranaerobius trueperi TaxID=759412 RepID=A0A226BWW6_9FIRM|nr:extracellular solute-binding protein [Natranaerobius trueperi]OWZ83513.1 iron transporter [Natranaerobius trueperi]
MKDGFLKIETVTKTLLVITLMLGVLLLAGCGSAEGENDELVVYSARNERFVDNLLDKFTEDTGIEVQALHGADAQQIEEESNNVQADVFISNDLGALGYLDQQELLQGAELEGIETIPEEFRSEDNSYFAISLRSRGFIYNKDMISEDEMPTRGKDLFDPKWADVEGGYAITRGGNGGMIGHVSALRYEWGDEKTSEWVESIRENAAGIYQGYSDVRRAVGAGEHAFGLVNNYYFHQQLEEPDNNNVGFIYLDQDEDEMGTVANAAGAGLVKDGPNEENAKVFLEWLLEEENQVEFVGESLELLINSEYGAEYPSEVEPHIVETDELNIQDMPIDELGNYYEDTTDLIEQSGLDLELR